MSFGRRRRQSVGFTLVEMLTVVTIIAMVMSILMPSFWYARDRTGFQACCQNLKSIAVGLQVYANENNQNYPTSLARLLPNYLSPALPTCPESSVNTYSPGYQVVTTPIPSYTVLCSGSNHTTIQGVPPNEPHYSAESGLGPAPW